MSPSGSAAADTPCQSPRSAPVTAGCGRSSSSISQRDIAEVLAGRAPYDDLSAREQAVVRAEWGERVTALREGLDLAAEFAAAGESWTEADVDGTPVKRSAEAVRPRRRRRTA